MDEIDKPKCSHDAESSTPEKVKQDQGTSSKPLKLLPFTKERTPSKALSLKTTKSEELIMRSHTHNHIIPLQTNSPHKASVVAVMLKNSESSSKTIQVNIPKTALSLQKSDDSYIKIPSNSFSSTLSAKSHLSPAALKFLSKTSMLKKQLENNNKALKIKASDQIFLNNSRITSLPSPMSLSSPHQPQALFLLALSKLNENSLNFSLINYLQSSFGSVDWKPGDITPPDSLASAPPSYSFVLRQSAARRRPRLMGTFIPSPSFVQHTPPPTYATAFDIYIDSGPPPPPRVYTFGFAPTPVICPECGFTGLTYTTCKITLCTHISAFILCLFCCWICAPLPYVLRSCKDVYHYCSNCQYYMGMYCPTNPDTSFPAR